MQIELVELVLVWGFSLLTIVGSVFGAGYLFTQGSEKRLSARMTRMETRLLGAISGLSDRMDRVDEWRVQQGERLTRIEASNHVLHPAEPPPEFTPEPATESTPEPELA